MKASKKVFVAMVLAVVFSTWGKPAWAGNPDQQYVDYPCVDVYDMYGDQFENCFGESDNLHRDQCERDFDACGAACNAQRVAAESACSAISDPVEQANCLAQADLNAQLCNSACGADFEAGWCP